MKKVIILTSLIVFGLACFGGGAKSPTDAYKGIIAAAQKKDPGAMRKYLSKNSLEVVKSSAGKMSKTEDELLNLFAEAIGDVPEMKNELIAKDGKTATLETKNKAGNWHTIDFSNENGWKLELEKPTAKTETADSSASKSSTGADDYSTKSTSSEPQETGPVTISASDLVGEARSSSSGMEKYRGRSLTVTGAELWEIQYGMLHIGPKYGSYSSGYIICKGSFSEYMPFASKISDLKRQGKAPGATIKGTFSQVVTDSGYTQVHIDPCVLSNLEK